MVNLPEVFSHDCPRLYIHSVKKYNSKKFFVASKMSILALMYCEIPTFSVKVYPQIYVFKICFQCNIYVSIINVVIVSVVVIGGVVGVDNFNFYELFHVIFINVNVDKCRFNFTLPFTQFYRTFLLGIKHTII